MAGARRRVPHCARSINEPGLLFTWRTEDSLGCSRGHGNGGGVSTAMPRRFSGCPMDERRQEGAEDMTVTGYWAGSLSSSVCRASDDGRPQLHERLGGLRHRGRGLAIEAVCEPPHDAPRPRQRLKLAGADAELGAVGRRRVRVSWCELHDAALRADGLRQRLAEPGDALLSRIDRRARESHRRAAMVTVSPSCTSANSSR